MDDVNEDFRRWVNKEEEHGKLVVNKEKEHRKLVVNKEKEHRRLVVKTDHKGLVCKGKRRRGMVGKESFREISREVVG